MKHTEYRQEDKMKRYPKAKNATLRKIGRIVARIRTAETRTYYAMGRVWQVAF